MNSDASILNAPTRQTRFRYAVLLLLLALPTAASAQRLVTGQDHACALTASGGVKCWGKNISGQLGDGTLIERHTPVDVIGLASGVTAISSGNGHVCALTNSGGVKCWGYGTYGQLGENSFESRSSPVDVLGLTSGVVAIAAGEFHSCAVLTNGAVKCWGRNDGGQLGDGSTTNRFTAVDPSGFGSGVAALALGRYHTCALTSVGGVKCLGNNMYGQLGDNTTTSRFTAGDVFGLTSGVTALTAGEEHSCAVTSVGAVKCWGDNSYAQLGDNSFQGRLIPTDVVGLISGYALVDGGFAHTCAKSTTGAVKCWGYNNNGQLGDNTITLRQTPVDVVGLGSGINAITVGYGFSCSADTSGVIKCWGDNFWGQLGNNSTVQQHTPVMVFGSPFQVDPIFAGSFDS